MTTHVPFITSEDGDDLIVSFGLGELAEQSLTLIRTPMYESLLAEEERGVTVGTGAMTHSERELLVSVQWSDQSVLIISTHDQYALDLRTVDPTEIEEAKAILRAMNFDKRFEVQGA